LHYAEFRGAAAAAVAAFADAFFILSSDNLFSFAYLIRLQI
jgi:hypothetical protein